MDFAMRRRRRRVRPRLEMSAAMPANANAAMVAAIRLQNVCGRIGTEKRAKGIEGRIAWAASADACGTSLAAGAALGGKPAAGGSGQRVATAAEPFDTEVFAELALLIGLPTTLAGGLLTDSRMAC